MGELTYNENATVLTDQVSELLARIEIRRQIFDRESLIQLAHDLEELAWSLEDGH